jgi:ParB family transcriptional regulator, chromosome partitioning protein
MALVDRTVVAANPFRCRMWDFHDRLESQLTEDTCREEIESIARHGQLMPVLGRSLTGDPDFDFELIYGARRLFVARHLDKPLLIDLRVIADSDAIVAMDIENRLRRDISPYERGRNFARYLSTGHFQTQEDLARRLKISPSQVSRLLKVARLPAAIVAAFESPTDICEGWAHHLTEILGNPERRERLLRKARDIAALTPRLCARDVYPKLIEEVRHRPTRPRYCDEVVKDDNGQPLLRIRRHMRWVALLVPTERVTPSAMNEMRNAVATVLRRDRPDERQEKRVVALVRRRPGGPCPSIEE